MKGKMKKQILTLAALASLLLLGSGSKALAVLQLKLTDNLGNTVTVTDNGSGDSSTIPGVIIYKGTVGNWTNIILATSKPFSGSATAPQMDISVQSATSSSSGGTLDI